MKDSVEFTETQGKLHFRASLHMAHVTNSKWDMMEVSEFPHEASLNGILLPGWRTNQEVS